MCSNAGLLLFGPKSSHCFQDAIRCLADSGTPHDRLSAQQVCSPQALYSTLLYSTTILLVCTDITLTPCIGDEQVPQSVVPPLRP